MKIVINRRYGGFGLSYKACMLYAKLSKFKLSAFGDDLKNDCIVQFPYTGKGKKPFCIHYYKNLAKGKKPTDKQYWSYRDIKRDDPILIKVVEKLGEEANGDHAELRIVEIPDGTSWQVEEYDGMEWIAETHQTWG